METYKLLKDLNAGQGSGFIKVRISREWDNRKPGSQYATTKTYIIVDEDGTQVQAGPIQSGLIAEFTKRLQLGSVYMISNYNVISAPDTYRPVPGEYIINFHRKTITKKLDDVPDIPRLIFALKTFQEARASLGDVVTLSDVAGKLIELTHIQTANSGKKSMDIMLKDERHDTIKVTLWESQAYNFLKWETEYRQSNVFVIVTGTSTKTVKGQVVLWSTNSTQYFFNIEHSAVMRLRENPNMKDKIIPAIVPFIHNPDQAMVENIETVTIEQLFDAQLPDGADTIRFNTEATVIGLIPHYGWYYIACSKCNRKMNAAQRCHTCPDETKPIPKYKITLAVQDSTSDTTFVIFDRHVMKLINVSAQHMLNNDQNATPGMIPPVLNNMLGRNFIFKLKLTPYNTIQKLEGYTVIDVQEVNITETTPKSHVDTPKEPSKSHPENKRKILDDAEKPKNALPAPYKLPSIVSELEQNNDPAGDANNEDESPLTSSAMKKKSGKQNNKRQK